MLLYNAIMLTGRKQEQLRKYIASINLNGSKMNTNLTIDLAGVNRSIDDAMCVFEKQKEFKLLIIYSNYILVA